MLLSTSFLAIIGHLFEFLCTFIADKCFYSISLIAFQVSWYSFCFFIYFFFLKKFSKFYSFLLIEFLLWPFCCNNKSEKREKRMKHWRMSMDTKTNKKKIFILQNYFKIKDLLNLKKFNKYFDLKNVFWFYKKNKFFE